MRHPAANARGSALVVLAAAVLLLAVILTGLVRTALSMAERNRRRQIADASVLAGAVSQAELMNLTALLHDGLLATEALAVGTVTVGGLGSVALGAGVVTLPEGIDLLQETLRIVDDLQDLNAALADTEDAVLPLFPILPLLAAQAPLATEDLEAGEWVLVPLPLPGTGGDGYSLEAPLQAERGYDLAPAANRRLLAELIGGQLDAVDFTQLEKAGKSLTRILCGGAKGNPGNLLARLFQGKGSEEDEGTACREAIDGFLPLASESGSAEMGNRVRDWIAGPEEAGGEADASGPATGEEIAGFRHPYALQAGYAERFHLGVVALTCKGEKNCGGDFADFLGMPMALSQARVMSAAQPDGGNLVVPDFAARLVPIDPGLFLLGIGAEAAGDDGGSEPEEDRPWLLLH